MQTSLSPEELSALLDKQLNKEQFLSAFKQMVEMIKNLKSDNQSSMAGFEDRYSQVVDEIKGKYNTSMADMKQKAMDYCQEEVNKLSSQVECKMAEVQNGTDGKDGNTIFSVLSFEKAPKEVKKGDIVVVENTGEIFIFE